MGCNYDKQDPSIGEKWNFRSLYYLKERRLLVTKWIFFIKYDRHRSLNWHKARLVAKGSTQSYVVCYEETFVVVAKLNSVESFYPYLQIWIGQYTS